VVIRLRPGTSLSARRWVYLLAIPFRTLFPDCTFAAVSDSELTVVWDGPGAPGRRRNLAMVAIQKNALGGNDGARLLGFLGLLSCTVTVQEHQATFVFVVEPEKYGPNLTLDRMIQGQR
jgi:hypothetical protein